MVKEEKELIAKINKLNEFIDGDREGDIAHVTNPPKTTGGGVKLVVNGNEPSLKEVAKLINDWHHEKQQLLVKEAIAKRYDLTKQLIRCLNGGD